MKKFISLITVFFAFMLLLFSATPAFAHPGGLDKYGCHHDRKTGYYHCHRPAAPEEVRPGQNQPERRFEPAEGRIALGNYHIARVRMVVDERVLELADGQRVALIGIMPAGPGGDQGRPSYPAEAAIRYAKTLVEGREVRLYFYRETTNNEGRWLAYVYSLKGIFLNAELVEQGLVKTRLHVRNNQFNQLFLHLEEKARQAQRGIWGYK